jgi:hypothetical protein
MSKPHFGPLSFSSLTAFAQSPRAFVHYKTRQRVTTPAMRMGTLAHRFILEPAEFRSTCVVYDGQRRGKDWTQFAAEHTEKDILTTSEMKVLTGMLEAIKSHPEAVRKLSECSQREIPLTWSKDGHVHRGIIDAFGSGFCLDLKMTVDVSERALTRVIYERRYFMQCAMYAHAMAYHGYDIDECYILAVQSAAPHHVSLCNIAPHYIARGHDEWTRLLQLFNDWDGESEAHTHGEDGEITIDAPGWAPSSQWMTT